MSDWAKGDGARIQVTFDRPLVGDVSGQQNHFTVTVPEYDMVPEGTLRSVTKAVKSTYAGSSADLLLLEMEPLQRFESAAGNITVAYDGGGTLCGEGGPVEAFTQTFTPTDLVPKPHQNDAEHIEISSIAATGTLTKINYIDTAAQDMGHIEITGITAVGTLTNVHDI